MAIGNDSVLSANIQHLKQGASITKPCGCVGMCDMYLLNLSSFLDFSENTFLYETTARFFASDWPFDNGDTHRRWRE